MDLYCYTVYSYLSSFEVQDLLLQDERRDETRKVKESILIHSSTNSPAPEALHIFSNPQFLSKPSKKLFSGRASAFPRSSSLFLRSEAEAIWGPRHSL